MAHRLLVALSLVALLTPACADGPSDSPLAPGSSPGGVASPRAAIQGPAKATGLAYGSLTASVQLAASGSASADGHYVIEAPGQPAAEIWVTTMQGDLSGGADTFFSGPFQLAYRIAVEGEGDLEVSAGYDGATTSISANGTVVADGQTLTVSLAYTDALSQAVDDWGLESGSNSHLQLTVDGPGLSLSGVEYYSYEAVAFDDLIENQKRYWGYSWTDNTGSYVLEAETFTAWKNAKASELDQWRIEGGVTRDGAPWGQVVFETVVDELVVSIDTPAEDIELVRFQLM